jgi:hypothetical protein
MKGLIGVKGVEPVTLVVIHPDALVVPQRAHVVNCPCQRASDTQTTRRKKGRGRTGDIIDWHSVGANSKKGRCVVDSGDRNRRWARSEPRVGERDREGRNEGGVHIVFGLMGAHSNGRSALVCRSASVVPGRFETRWISARGCPSRRLMNCFLGFTALHA